MRNEIMKSSLSSDNCPKCNKRHRKRPVDCIQETKISHAIHAGVFSYTSIATCHWCQSMYDYAMAHGW